MQQRQGGTTGCGEEWRKGHALAAGQRMDALWFTVGVTRDGQVRIGMRLRPQLRDHEDQCLERAQDRSPGKAQQLATVHAAES